MGIGAKMPGLNNPLLGPVPPVPMLQYSDTSQKELDRLRDDIYVGKYPNGLNVDHSFSFWRIAVDYADGTEHFVVEPGDVVVWQEKIVWHFTAKDRIFTAYSRYKTSYREL